MLKLVLPSIKYKKSFLQDYLKRKDPMIESYLLTQLSNKEIKNNFKEFIRRVKLQSKGQYLKPSYIPSTKFWLVEGSKFLGQCSIRHELTPFLKKIGGHIGYYIRPSERQKGYGKLILKLSLKKAKKLGIKKALLTCDEINLGSKKIIEANDGKFAGSTKMGKGLPDKLRYWIKT